MKIYIWGTGCSAGDVISKGVKIDDVAAFVDSSPHCALFMGKPVISPEELARRDYELVLAASRSSGEILRQCRELGIDRERLLFVKNNFSLHDMNESYAHAEGLLGSETLSRLIPSCHVLRDNSFCPSRLSRAELENDYARLRTLELLVRELEGVEGQAAELGVYRGGFARFINLLMPDRRLYLFDSFQGFDEGEARSELADNNCTEAFVEAHRSTSLQRVLSLMPHPEQLVIKQGYFPQSLEGLEERFALVSLDADFEESSYAGLEYFVPRTGPGGYILLHDCNSALSGVRRALERYERDSGRRLRRVPVCDCCGTVILCI